MSGLKSLLDPVDIAILEALQDNGRIGMSELGRRIGLSQPATSERVKHMSSAIRFAAPGSPIATFPAARALSRNCSEDKNCRTA